MAAERLVSPQCGETLGGNVGYLGEFEQLILFSVLQLGEGAYGVSIRETIEQRTGRAVSSGAIYTTLGRLEERGLVRSSVHEREHRRVGRPRKYYQLRPAGARALRDSYAAIQAMAGGLALRLTELAEGR
jgi:DNA-binding PadR family transcriptional regulator